ncbi:MAG TPA: hypothetical protein VHX44_12425 [Planctomycetota bacterium]|jgi:hypothetical protein|nr:hypothetical protein [Planctomycetota bacterium]
MSDQSVTVRLHRSEDASQRAWLTLRVTRHEDPRQVQIDIDPALAVRSDPTCFLHPPNESEAKVLKSDLVGGVLMARKQLGKIGFTVRLLTLGGATGDEARVTQISSVAFAVGAHAAVLTVLGDDQLRADLIGGFGWKIDAIEPAAG